MIEMQTLEPRRILASAVAAALTFSPLARAGDLRVTDFGAIPDDGRDDRPAIQAALNAATPADKVVFPAGKYHVNGQLQVHSNTFLYGPLDGNKPQSTIEFRTATNAFAINLDSGAASITINGLAIRANCGGIYGQGISNVKITNNDLQWGYDGTYYNRLGVRVFGASGLRIENNLFHDSTSSDRCIDLWDLTDSSYSFNRVDNVNDGGHIDGKSVRVKANGNYFTRVKRMALEWQDHNHYLSDFGFDNECVGNVAYDFREVFPDTFAYSVIMQGARGTRIANNYLEANFATEADTFKPPAGWEARFGIGIEAGGSNGIIVENNVIVNRDRSTFNTFGQSWVQGITYSMKGTIMRGNKFYGPAGAWGYHGPEGGLDGAGALNINASTGNQFGLSPAPARPTVAQVGAGINAAPTSQPTSQPSTQPAPQLTGLSLKEWRDAIDVSWQPRVGGESVTVEVTSGVGTETTAVVPASQGTFRFIPRPDQVSSTWRFNVYLTLAGGAKQYVGEGQVGKLSNPPTTQPSTQPTTMPTLQLPSYDIVIPAVPEKIIRVRNGVVENATTRPAL